MESPDELPHPLLQRWSHAGPKRILSIDGGGVRGIVALGFLEQIEARVRQDHGVANLAEHFDLIAGTSTGSIIAALLAMGKQVAEIRRLYLDFCQTAFTPSFIGRMTGGMMQSKFRQQALHRLAREVFKNIELGHPEVLTGLMIMMHRADTCSPWPVHNHPRGKYYADGPNSTHFANGRLPLGNLVMASCAAPSYFRPQRIEIARLPGGRLVQGLFVDGSVSPHKNPALQALRVATIPTYGFGWAVGEENLILVSVGTGMRRRRTTDNRLLPSGVLAITTLLSLLDTCNDEVELMLQWLSNSTTARLIDSEVGTLADCCLTGKPVLQYYRYNLPLDRQWLAEQLKLDYDEATLDRFYRLDGVRNVPELDKLSRKAAALIVPS